MITTRKSPLPIKTGFSHAVNRVNRPIDQENEFGYQLFMIKKSILISGLIDPTDEVIFVKFLSDFDPDRLDYEVLILDLNNQEKFLTRTKCQQITELINSVRDQTFCPIYQARDQNELNQLDQLIKNNILLDQLKVKLIDQNLWADLRFVQNLNYAQCFERLNLGIYGWLSQQPKLQKQLQLLLKSASKSSKFAA